MRRATRLDHPSLAPVVEVGEHDRWPFVVYDPGRSSLFSEKIDAKGMTREVVTQDDLKVVETYALSADGKQLVVTLKASQPVMKIEDAKIKRVYDRQ